MRSPSKPATFGIASIIVTLIGLYGVLGGAGAEWQVPLCAAGLIFGSIGTAICAGFLLVRGLRRALHVR